MICDLYFWILIKYKYICLCGNLMLRTKAWAIFGCWKSHKAKHTVYLIEHVNAYTRIYLWASFLLLQIIRIVHIFRKPCIKEISLATEFLSWFEIFRKSRCWWKTIKLSLVGRRVHGVIRKTNNRVAGWSRNGFQLASHLYTICNKQQSLGWTIFYGIIHRLNSEKQQQYIGMK